jgi:uncharacterized protein YbaA (DUF1428 family)
MSYVDGFLLVVPTKKLPDYLKMAKLGAKVWMKHGAVDYKECIGEDMSPAMAELTFPKVTKCKDDETVIFSFITFKSRKHRDQVNAKVFKDPLMSPDAMKDKPMPFDMKRMAYGGFETKVQG